MPNYFVKSSSFGDGLCIIEGDDFHHLIKVRRTALGAKLSVVDESGRRFNATVREIGEGRVVCEAAPDDDNDFGVFLQLSLYAAVLKGKKFDIVIQKAVELGVSRIIPLVSERCVPDYGEKAGSKTARWRRIAEEAAKQSLRALVPEVTDIISFADAVVSDDSDARIIAHPAAALRFSEYAKSISAPRSAALFTGPEGGFSDSETMRAADAGWSLVGFDFPQLRAETAAIVLPAVMIYEWGGVKA